MARLFVAITLPREVGARLAALPRHGDPGLRWTPRRNLHVTLRFLGDAVVPDVAAALDAAALPAATAELGPAVEELRPGVVVVPVAGVDALAAAVVRATAGLGRPPPARPFRGHVTVARRRGRGGRGSDAPPEPTPVATSFTVTDVALVDSDTRPTGAVHTVLGRWPVG